MTDPRGLPLVSIITPVYNGADFIEEMIESALGQTYPRIEHLVIDDGSTDGGRTVEILKRYPHLRWWTRPNIGQYATQNEGLRAATGEWVTCTGQDDRYHNRNSIQAAVEHAFAHPKADVVRGMTLHIDVRGMPLPVQPPQRFPHWSIPYCLTFSHCSLFVRASIISAKNAYFNESLKYTGDADWIFRLHQAGARFSRLDQVVSDYRHHAMQLTSIADANAAASLDREWEERRLRNEFGRSQFIRYLVTNWVNFEKRKRKVGALLRGYRPHNGIWVKRK